MTLKIMLRLIFLLNFSILLGVVIPLTILENNLAKAGQSLQAGRGGTYGFRKP